SKSDLPAGLKLRSLTRDIAASGNGPVPGGFAVDERPHLAGGGDRSTTKPPASSSLRRLDDPPIRYGNTGGIRSHRRGDPSRCHRTHIEAGRGRSRRRRDDRPSPPDDNADTHARASHYRRDPRRLVTVIEILSPTNKRGDGYEEYRDKRERILRSTAHLMEI